MAKGERAATVSNNRREYWSRRPYSNRGGCTRGKSNKQITHRLERRREKRKVDAS